LHEEHNNWIDKEVMSLTTHFNKYNNQLREYYENIDDEGKKRKVIERFFLMCMILLQMNHIYREIQEYENGLMGQLFCPMNNGHPPVIYS
jgi:hypothetical protein